MAYVIAERTGTYTVTVGLVDGQQRSGRLTRFQPFATDILLEVPRPGTAPLRTSLASERVAYVAFHRDASDRPAPSVGAKHVRVHVAGGISFEVDAVGVEAPGVIGFYAYSKDDKGPYYELFFYAHGVNAKEAIEPLGAMLVTEGVVSAEALARGLAAQTAQRNVPVGELLIELRKVQPAAIEEAVIQQKRRRMRIGEVLVEAGVCTEEDVATALAEQKKRAGKRLGEVLVDLALVSEEQLATTLAKKFHLPFLDLERCRINPAAAYEVGADFIAKYGVLPIDADPQSLTVALSDPLALEAIDVLRFRVKRPIVEVLVMPAQLKAAVAAHLQAAEKASAAPGGEGATMGQILKALADERFTAGEGEQARENEARESDSAVIKLANQIILDAYRRGASDIHIEPNGHERATTVRFRVDGDCIQYQDIPPAYRSALVSRLKIMAELDISERRKPQDGKIRFKTSAGQIELRVATLPTVNGNEDVVLRILAASRPTPLEKMGMSARNLRELKAAIAKPYGLVLCVGPTGSGKTTTLHSALAAINTADMKIWTAEDPVEITQPGLRQLQVNPKVGLTFAAAMRAFLRADPDVIMVGEMRDHETASPAAEASLTGHLVFSTLHTNSAPETVTRLLDIGLDPFSFADALIAVLAQRLARALCAACRKPTPGSRQAYDELAGLYGNDLPLPFGPDFAVWRAQGCETCGGTGYKGRVALHELLVNDPQIKRAVARKSPVDETRRLAVEGGMTTLLQDGVEKILAGLTDVRQVLAVCSA